MSALKSAALLAAAMVLPTGCGSSSSRNKSSSSCMATSATQTTSVSMVDTSFSPDCIKISAGQSVTWTNNSSLTHTVTSDSGAPVSFDSGGLAPGATFTFTFPSAGTVTYDLRSFPRDAKDRFLESVVNGKNNRMPPWGDVLSLDEIEAVWAYVRTRGK